MTRTFKALSALLTYPSSELQAAIPDIRAVLAEEAVLPPPLIEALQPLLQRLTEGDIIELQEAYVLLFDRSRTLSLNLFEHVHGESRDRGGAMVDLLETYRAGGFDLVGPELPDHLPVLLEFLSTRLLAETREILADAGPILVALAERLTRRETPYAAILVALADLGRAAADTGVAAALLSQKDDDPEDLAALDAVWEEAQVTFAPDPNAGCPVSRDILAAMDTPLNPARAGAGN
ncbi:nitrate reductase molybdenum cofactor assembly chaperone [Aurantimonas sp. C2-6-R+9]|uniref:nitrate reductase molybdenum cofactor assembly chaperone n=1 Tax=unclassified Aurantimonas TaxID=2638230 RepID=UPI002E1873FB|nr:MULTISPECIES: nitrate reductase molybdenum cofactor assembly chaperone [unclassified Aurantimonas]MEC5290264.1 nitrate reductase molybdenum cofactor assembly chaperone [Aurantimonas sp. C2-3-R2]MEC5380375.1 nitrate reductase molybdenum cofactor assembly chaperone [Aurantimonas sp. C2-6-R+9]MEC5411328.1 nitrate reductase molybdenum cofactor assembly chaperone [Aurantimonas sp. C2-4-R8]